MYSINKLYKLLPIKVKDRKLNFLTVEDIDKYSKILKSEYYNQYIDSDYNDYPISKIRTGLTILANNYSMLIKDDLEVKLLLKDITGSNTIYGGVTIREVRKTTLGSKVTYIELGYWVNEKYTGQGICTDMLTELISKLKASDMNITYIKCVVQKINHKSSHILKKLGFNKENEYIGAKCTNEIYTKYL